MTQDNHSNSTENQDSLNDKAKEKTADTASNAAQSKQQPPQSLSSDVEFQKMVEEISGLRHELHAFRQQGFVKLHNSKIKMTLFQLFRGMAFGLGSVLGATVILGFLVYFLSSIDFIPIIGDWAKEILMLVTGSQQDVVQYSQEQAQNNNGFFGLNASHGANLTNSVSVQATSTVTNSVTMPAATNSVTQ